MPSIFAALAILAALPAPATSADVLAPHILEAKDLDVPWPETVSAHLAAAMRRGPGPYAVLAEGLASSDAELAGARVLARVGPVTSIVAPRSAMRALSAKAKRLDAPKPLRPALDKSRVLVGADQADFADGFDVPYRGAGALVATYDSGIDLLHPDFWTLDGKTRIAALFDQSTGATCDRAGLQARLCPEDDLSGHGTLVLSVALGNGPRYRGIAPEAEAVVVRSETFDDLVGAMAFFETVAAAEKKPLVLNLSLGGHSGPHDGTSLEAVAMSAFGHVVVAAAGNDGGRPIHASGALDGQHSLVIQRSPGSTKGSVELWGTKDGSLDVHVRLVDEVGADLARTGSVSPGAGRTDTLMIGGVAAGTFEVDVAGPSPANGRPSARIAFEVDEAGLGAARIAIFVSGTGSVDAWTDAPADVPDVPRFETATSLGAAQLLGDSESSLSDPATAKDVLCVASYQSRNEAPTEDEGAEGIEGPISPFTAKGPTLDQARTGEKPDLAAPGEIVVAARAKNGIALGALGPLYRAGAGTSLAAPHVAGAAAVLLAARPDAEAGAVRAWLRDSAHREDGDARFGRGRLSLSGALEAAGEGGCSCHATGVPSSFVLTKLLALALFFRSRRQQRPA
ncbi:MAG: S8 family serine peptidase [Deltaproteobacteria bacterium]|nr:S8 family serine peptidase [Deltaproteobacteria bacterium]